MGNSCGFEKDEESGHHVSPAVNGNLPKSESITFIPTDSSDLIAKQHLAAIQRQDYNEIREKCIKNGTLWEDPVFPAENYSIYRDGRPRFRIRWMRPKEICETSHLSPKFYVKGPSRFDLIQGELGDCWVLAALASLADKPSLLRKVIPYPTEPSFQENAPEDLRYIGIFRFRFFHFGEWLEVCVDDRLPVFQDAFRDRLLMVHSGAENEFWGALVEKAYAKLYGCYESLKSGVTSDALTDFTGGICECYRLKEEDIPGLDVIIEQAVHRNALICTGIWLYVVDSEDICLVRIRNPWGNWVEWRGAWSDRSFHWRYLSDTIREELEHRLRNDGEFWMDLRDFKATFDDVDICNLAPDCPKVNGDICIRTKTVERCYVRTSESYTNWTFGMNPQFAIRIRDEGDRDKVATVVVELTQKSRRRRLKPNFSIGFIVFPRTARVGAVDFYTNLRAVSKRLDLYPGRYVIVVSTWEPNQPCEFMLRVWSEAPFLADNTMAFRFSTPVASHNSLSRSGGENKVNNNSGLLVERDCSMALDSGGEKDGDERSLERKAESLEDMIFDAISNGSRSENVLISSGSSSSTVAGSEEQEPYTSDDCENEMNPVVKGAALNFFQAVAGRDMALNAFELQRGLNSLYSRSPKYFLSVDCCKSLIVFVDKKNEKFRLNWRQFRLLYRFLNLWTRVFLRFDGDKDGFLSVAEFQSALFSLGYEENLRGRKLQLPREPTKLKEGETEWAKWDKVGGGECLSSIQRAMEFHFSDEMGRVSFSSFIHAVVRFQRALVAVLCCQAMSGLKSSLGLRDVHCSLSL